jgi:serine protease Do
MRHVALALALLVVAFLGFLAGPSLPGGAPRDAVAGPAPFGPPDFAEAAERAEPGVVQVTNLLEKPRSIRDADGPEGGRDFVGSGFVYSPDGLVVTNGHVVTGAQAIFVDVKGRAPMPARVVAYDSVVDVALLRVDATGLVPLALGDPRSLRVGQWVIAAGSPYRLPRSFSVGIVSALGRSDVVSSEGYEDYIQTDAAVNVGSSGGPLLDAAGRVVGMNTAILSRSGLNQGIALALPIDVVRDVVEQLRTTGRVIRSSLGLVVRSADVLVASRLPGGQGVEVTRFEEGSPGRRAGLQAGDVILEVDGTPVGSKNALQRVVWSRPPGATVQVKFWRGDRALTVAAVLGAR